MKIITTSPHLDLACQIASQEGVDAALVCAIVMTESSWRQSVVNLGPGDADRGGAYGLGQLTLKTAKALGFTGTPHELEDPAVNLEYVCKLIKDNTKPGETVLDVVCRYNSGKPFSRAPSFTKRIYLTRVVDYQAAYKRFLAHPAA